MLPVLFKIGPVTIYSFGFFLTVAYFVATFILWREGKRQGYNEEKLLDLSVISLIAAILGGRVYYLFLNWQFFSDEPVRAFYFWEGGFAYHGALVGVLLAALYFIKKWKWSFFQIGDIAALSTSVALVFGKTGKFLAGLDYGKESLLPWSVKLPGLIGSRHPVQLYEAGSYFIIFVILYFLFFRNLVSSDMKSGKVFFIFMISTSLVGGFLEFFRAEHFYIYTVPLASVVSLAIATISIIALYYFQIRNFRSDAATVASALLGLNTRLLRKFRF